MWERLQPALLLSKMTVELYPSRSTQTKEGLQPLAPLRLHSAGQRSGAEGLQTHLSVPSPLTLSLTFLSCLQN